MGEMSEDELRLLILDFLRDFKELMGAGAYLVKDHLKNLQTLKYLRITTRMRDDIILSIRLEDYSAGPKTDQLHSGEYWEFGKEMDGEEIYIKLKIIPFSHGNEKALCLSFHIAERPLNYRFRQ